jgi:hypothetical protein
MNIVFRDLFSRSLSRGLVAFGAGLFALSSMRCATPVRPAPDRGNSATALKEVVPSAIQVPPGMRRVVIGVAPVESSGAMPGQPGLFRDTVHRCVLDSLASGMPTVRSESAASYWSPTDQALPKHMLVDPDFSNPDRWVLAIDLQQFRKAPNTAQTTKEQTSVGPVLSLSEERTDRWQIVAGVRIFNLSQEHLPMVAAWTVEIEANETVRSREKYGIGVGGGQEIHRSIPSFAECLATIAQKVAQEAVERINDIQHSPSSQAQSSPPEPAT